MTAAASRRGPGTQPFGARLRRLVPSPHDRPWLAAVFLIAMLAAAPVASIVVLAMGASGTVWPHLVATVLPAALADTAVLLGGVAIVTIGIGVTSAWLVCAYAFPGRRIFEWALLLPLAMPTYIVAYAYVDMLDSFGPVQSGLRALFGWHNRRDYAFPEIRSMGGAILLMGSVLYPYVYLTARAMFLMQSSCVIEVARTLGAPRRALLARSALPLARPAVAVGSRSP